MAAKMLPDDPSGTRALSSPCLDPVPEPLCVHDYEPLARERLEGTSWDYFQGGSDDEVTLRRNCEAFASFRLRPRVLVDVSRCDAGTTVLGARVSSPVLVAPVAYQRLAHPEGELATVRAAGRAGTVMIASTMATTSIEDIALAAGGPLWFQLYAFRDHGRTRALIERAEAAGCRALVITVDAPRLGRRERDLRNGFSLPAHLTAENLSDVAASSLHARAPAGVASSALAEHADSHFDAAFTWASLDRVRSSTRLPVVLKGILTAEDGRIAGQNGVAGVVVSNHGGRQLDGVSATIEVVSEIADALTGTGCEVYMDGGVRRGTDVLKALALGARAVLVGRPVLWGLAARGEEGVHHVLELLRSELELAMALSGKPDISSITRELVTRARGGPP